MENFLGFLELLAWIVGVVSLAAVVTYTVIKITQRFEKKPEPEPTRET